MTQKLFKNMMTALACLETIRTEKLAAAGLHAEAEAVSRARLALDGAECNCGGKSAHLLSCPLNPAYSMLNKQHDAEREARACAGVGGEGDGRNESVAGRAGDELQEALFLPRAVDLSHPDVRYLLGELARLQAEVQGLRAAQEFGDVRGTAKTEPDVLSVQREVQK